MKLKPLHLAHISRERGIYLLIVTLRILKEIGLRMEDTKDPLTPEAKAFVENEIIYTIKQKIFDLKRHLDIESAEEIVKFNSLEEVKKAEVILE